MALGHDSEIGSYAQSLLLPSQQRLPDRLAEALERVINDPTSATVVIELAREGGFA